MKTKTREQTGTVQNEILTDGTGSIRERVGVPLRQLRKWRELRTQRDCDLVSTGRLLVELLQYVKQIFIEVQCATKNHTLARIVFKLVN